MVSQLEFGVGGRPRLKQHRDLGEHDRLARLLRACQAFQGGVEFFLRGPLAGGDLPPPGEGGGS